MKRKLTAFQILEIRRRTRNGHRVRHQGSRNAGSAIAKEFGVSPALVSLIAAGKYPADLRGWLARDRRLAKEAAAAQQAQAAP